MKEITPGTAGSIERRSFTRRFPRRAVRRNFNCRHFTGRRRVNVLRESADKNTDDVRWKDHPVGIELDTPRNRSVLSSVMNSI